MAEPITTAPEVVDYWRTATPYMRHERVPQHVAAITKRLHGIPSGAKALDYGCGGGAGLIALEQLGCDPTGVDLVMTHQRFLILRPHELHAIEPESFGAVISTSVFQHLPDEAYALRVLRELRRLAAPGAFGLVQVRYFNPGDAYDPATMPAEYAARVVRSHSWRIDAFWQALERVGFAPLSVELEPYRQYAWFRFAG